MTRLFALLALVLTLLAAPMTDPAAAQDGDPVATDPGTGEIGGPADDTGGRQTLEDILRRQQGLASGADAVRPRGTGNPDNAQATTDPLGALGGASDPDLWRAIRTDSARIVASNSAPGADVLVQDGGMHWLEFRRGPLLTWGGIGLLVTLGLLAAFYLFRGRIEIEGPKTGLRLPRFNFVERLAHWTLAGSFILLALTGLISIFGRKFLIPLVGHDLFSPVARGSKFIHDNVSWAFMLALAVVIVLWVVQNIPNRHDLKWLAMGGGIFGKGHAPAKKFNAGQKMIFWAVVVLGLSISASGLSLLFPFQLHLFTDSFHLLNQTGLPQAVGYGPLPEAMPPHQEMQLSQAWHAIVGFLFMALILAHIYLGTVGMEGAFDAMGRGDVEEEWAREHHNLWVEELEREGVAPRRDAGHAPRAAPAE